jgi:two-component system, NarL family, response regulator NreC
MIRIVLVDDHNIILEGISSILKEVPDFLIVGYCNNGDALINHLSQQENTDIILLDISMPKTDTLDVVKTVIKHYPKVGIIILTMHDDLYILRQFLNLGVRGYLLKNTTKTELVMAIRKAHQGGLYLSERISDALKSADQLHTAPPKHLVTVPRLTTREKEVLRLLADGLKTHDIATRLNVSDKAVEFHRSNLLTKFGVSNSISLLKIVNQHHLWD